MHYLAVVQRLLDEGAARAVVGESRKGNSMESHWNRLGQAYEQEWNSPAKQALSRDELGFVARHIEGTSARRVLDVGIGTGRILGAILSQPRVEEVVGIDASEEMVEACKQAFSSHPKVQALQVCDVSSGDLPGETLFDFISAIRVLKYEKTWQEIVQKLVSRLNSGGALIFTIPNRRSLNLLSRRYAVPWYSTSKGEVLGLCEGLDVELIELISFTKLPFALYNAARGDLIGRVPPMLDRMLDLALGPRLLGREFFVAVRRVSLR
jgi:SAM-dependent methyltransferase